ncbi:hypothetical protein HOLleu_34252 [Holothuria leucospilota]|uniref:Uncharacterized protein n=1 Tax=Holothuria leucospilota TaxID=206669 RepID=A0A9Q0YKQ3_HOLLE|nr:hypothetical protein HOLleu_34252 [Holothuria leucospilota]
MFADHSQRLKSLKTQDVSQTMLEFSAYGKKPPVTNFVRKMQQERCMCNEGLSSLICQMDVAWALVRLCPTRLFEVELISSPTGEQQVSSWTGFNVIIHQSIQMHTTVGYCRMIHGSSTEFSTVYTLMKKIQVIMISLGQSYTVITFELAICIKAKEIQWCQPEEFANTVIRMGSLHIILNYLSLVMEKSMKGQMLLQFLRAEPSEDWLLHLSIIAAMTPHFYAFDIPNYSKWLPVYLSDMNNLPQSHPIAHQEFIYGDHSVNRSGNPISNVSSDMALEESINRDSKTKGGIVGISKESGALERWFLTSHQWEAITTALKYMRHAG